MTLQRRRLTRLGLLACVALISAIGCGRNYAVDGNLAQDKLKLALDAWRQGQTPEQLQAQGEQIAVQDPDWERGAKLSDYQILEVSEPEGPNLYCTVELSLEDPQGKPVKSSVRYCVTTNPNVTVFRALF